MIIATIVFDVACKKQTKDLTSLPSMQDTSHRYFPSFFFSPWLTKWSGTSIENMGIADMTAPDQTTCYGLMYNSKVTITHDGGDTWRAQTIPSLQNNSVLDISSATAQSVHVIALDPVHGGGTIFRSEDGGDTWEREGANAFTNAASFPDVVHFFDSDNGVIFGDPVEDLFEIYTTSDNGDSWNRVSSDNVPARLPNEYGITNLSDAFNNTIWVVTIRFDDAFNPIGARLLQSDDRGHHWYVKNSSIAIASRIKFRNELAGLYADNANAKLYRTIDGGVTWNEVNYSGPWHSYDFDNVPGRPGVWISVAGRFSPAGLGSSISYDDGEHWSSLDDNVVHTCVTMTSSIHGYSGSITNGVDDGVFVYSSPPGQLTDQQ